MNKINKTLLLITIFSFGYILNDILKGNSIELINKAYADVAGMGYSELRRDRDFKRAVQYIVEDCDVTGGYIDGGYVDDSGYLYGAYLYGAEVDC